MIKLLLENREVIYYCTRYHQCHNEKEKEAILEEMKARDISIAVENKKRGQKAAPKKTKIEQKNK